MVEFTPENGFYPTVLASPAVCKKPEEVENDETLDFKQYCLDGRVVLQKKKFPPFYTKHKSWQIYLKKQERLRNQDKVRNQMLVDYGEYRSFLTEKYPECRPPQKKPKTVTEEEEAA